MALGLSGCGLFGPCLEPTPCLSVVDPCSQDPRPPDCGEPVPIGPCLEHHMPPAVCLSVVPPTVCLKIDYPEPCLSIAPEPDPPKDDCDPATDDDCPSRDEARQKAKEALPEDVKEKVE
ncbi:MAG TPA: hypothetical protein QGF58_25810 [Myxococcota bacterium]|nr:hypothetical protein [Myxococcota bacterium]